MGVYVNEYRHKLRGMWSAALETLSGFLYGSPAGEGGVDGGGTPVAQWLFDESSGNIVDEVSGATLQPGSFFTPVYNQGASGDFSQLAPGIQLVGRGFYTASAISGTSPGTGSFVIEWTALRANQVGAGTVACIDDTTAKGLQIYHNGNTNLTLYVSTEEGTTANFIFNGITNVTGDGQLHNYKLVKDNSVNRITFYIDNVSQGFQSSAAISGETITAYDYSIGMRGASAQVLYATLYEYRQVNGTATADSKYGE